MSKVILSMGVSLDGYIEGPNREFVPPPWNDELAAYSRQTLARIGGIIYGRVSFEFNAAFWSPAEIDPTSEAAKLDFAPVMNRLPKLVMSRTLREVGWNGRVVKDDVAAAVEAMKRETGKDLACYGGAQAANTLIRLGLVDEYWFMVSPFILGGGTPLFETGLDRTTLDLVSCSATETGVLLTQYRPRR